jgi:hypothetical protein
LIINREGEAYRVAATFAQTPEFDAVMRGRLLTADRGSVAGRTAIEGQVIHIHDIASDPEYTMTEAVTLGKNRTILGVMTSANCRLEETTYERPGRWPGVWSSYVRWP